MKNIPFFSLAEQTRGIRSEVDAAIAGVVDNTAFVLGPTLEQFEKDFAAYCGTTHCAGASCGTTALQLALLAAGIGPGDEVITVANTFIATVEAIAMIGAKPVIVDVLESTALIDPALIESALTPKTKAIIPVHLFGQTCDMDAIMSIAEGKGIVVIEDSCQAHGAMYRGRRAGSLGHAGAFSFYPSKNLGAFGEGGAITTSDERIVSRVKGLRHHGQFRKNEHAELGYNYRLHSLQAAILGVKLAHLDEWNGKRRELAARYRAALGEAGFWMPEEADGCTPVYHLFPIAREDRDAIGRALTDEGIGWGQHYPVPVHLQPAFHHLGYGEGDFPVSERLMKTSLTLPMFPELTGEEVDRVCEVLVKL